MAAEDKGQSLFEYIAPAYSLFYAWQRKRFAQVLGRVRPAIDLSAFETALDVGCGPGALASALQEQGLRVTGVDPAGKMLAAARRRPENRGIEFVQADALEGLPFPDKSFDLVIASYVAHGMQPQERQRLYAEMRRLGRHYVILHEFNRQRSPLITLAETLEGGDYFNFIQVAEEELQAFFGNLLVLPVEKRASWYICQP